MDSLKTFTKSSSSKFEASRMKIKTRESNGRKFLNFELSTYLKFGLMFTIIR